MISKARWKALVALLALTLLSSCRGPQGLLSPSNADFPFDEPARVEPPHSDERVFAESLLVYVGPIPGKAPEKVREADVSVLYAGTRGTLEFRYTVATSGPVRLEIFNVAGKKVQTLVNRVMAPGEYSCRWNFGDSSTKRVAAGVYFVRLSDPTHTVTQKFVLL